LSDDPALDAYLYAGAFVEEMARAGVRHVCISPGSRSTPLALAIANERLLESWVHVDERSSAFFALGLARASGDPVAVVCTSGTAAANFYPAIVEARSAGIPLLILTADRPPELRDVGAAQTIDQNRLYGSHVKWFVEVALPEATHPMLRYARTLAARAVAQASDSPAGPVHLNFPFREPLVPRAGTELKTSEGRADGRPWVRVTKSPRTLGHDDAAKVAARLTAAQRPIVVCGPQYDVELAKPVTSLARAIGAPVLADPLSQVRWGIHDRKLVVDSYDAFLRHERISSALDADLIVRIGGTPTSKALLQYLERQRSAPLIVIAESQWPDPSLLAEEMIRSDPAATCSQLAEMIASEDDRDPAWIDEWLDAARAARNALNQYSCTLSEPFEGAVLADVVTAVPDGATLFVSSSMPVRDMDAFAAGDKRSIRVMSNRGANGIDGVVSTALGAAAASRNSGSGPLVLVIGDLAFYHDMNGLLAAKLHGLDATIVIVNNDGGGIFSFLPQAEHELHFEKLFGTPHGLDFEPVASIYGAAYQRADDMASLRRCVNDALSRGGLQLVEIRTDRARNVTLHREAWEAVATALDDI
jgi:2-succinyl-5-enolpyruvyl-6-hydroxy-3-cyclohexene-1-carboxylate synthase